MWVRTIIQNGSTWKGNLAAQANRCAQINLPEHTASI
jgi:hypothetical protein